MAAETDYKNDYPTYRGQKRKICRMLSTPGSMTATKIYDELKQTHIEDHQSLFDRVSLDLGEFQTSVPTDQLIDEYRNGQLLALPGNSCIPIGRYLTIAGSRGTLPSNLVGLWTVGPSAWTGDYHF